MEKWSVGADVEHQLVVVSLLASLPKFLVGGKWSVGADVEHHIQYRLSSCHGSNRTIAHAG